MTFRPELIDELLKDYKNVDDLMRQGGIFNQLSKAKLLYKPDRRPSNLRSANRPKLPPHLMKTDRILKKMIPS